MLEYLKPHQSFQSVDQMDEHVEKHLKFHDLTKSEQAILRTISQHALATPGAAHLKAKTIADKNGLSTKTVYRSVTKFEQLGIVKKVNQTKMNGIKGANIYVICPYVPSKKSDRRNGEIPTPTSSEPLNKGNESLSFQSFCSKELIYTRNEWHDKLIQIFMDWPFNESIKEQLEDAICQLPLDNAKDFHRAKQIIPQLMMRIQTGQLTIHSSLKAVLLGAYNKWVLPPTVSTINKVEVTSKRPVPFYDWLAIRA